MMRLWLPVRWLVILVMGCPVCGRRRKHLIFCRYAPR